MQKMLDLCDKFSVDLDVRFNTMKSVAMRIGPRLDVVCAELTLSGGIIQYVQSLKYFGVFIKQVGSLHVTLTISKLNFVERSTVFMQKVLQEIQS